MPVIKSAEKAVRQTRVRQRRNKIKKAALAKQIAVLKKTTKSEKPGLEKLYSLADRAARKHIIHPKKAARIKSRYARKFAAV